MRMADTEYEAEQKAKTEDAKAFMLLGKISDDEIASCIGFSKERIEEIRKELEKEGKLPKK